LLPNALQRSGPDHAPVLADEVARLLAVSPGDVVVDATFGAGGHARVLAVGLGGRGRYIAIDRDPEARDLVNDLSERELADLFRRYGEERFARQIARTIVRRRGEHPFERSGELVDAIRASIPAPRRFGDGHPAKRVFQALRIAVNDELGALERVLPATLDLLRPGGRLCVISFHSLEDRIVKHFLAAESRGCTCPPELPVCVCGREPALRLLTRKALRPTPDEVAENPRAASARLRAALKVRER
jgi:16S rRNA (cytosine1402-N4)-methyltransferase